MRKLNSRKICLIVNQNFVRKLLNVIYPYKIKLDINWSINLVPRALFPGFGGGAGFSRPTSKARE